MIINEIGELLMQHSEPLGLLRTNWAAGRDMSHFRDALTRAQAVAQRLSVRRCLIELDALPDISAYDQAWLATQWIPNSLHLSLKQVVIVLSPRRIYNQQAVEGLLLMARPFIKFDVQFFSQPVAGLRWLTDYSPLVPELLHEWDVAFGPTPPPPGGVQEPRAYYDRP
ncbi:hypothetical protein [Hymenobacter coccineus]|uniref:STAS/SEC14 domain-containing protein n=1 Tax=Hymenobacter coccineus TaxID=1908235 RepID=A0A1G1T1S6_9BACT|nr:hypothetical protein [Hymenobacter coccineus]OGX84820.1 hypothetical protein BEN49_01595 [Hymenobacter coccineus]